MTREDKIANWFGVIVRLLLVAAIGAILLFGCNRKVVTKYDYDIDFDDVVGKISINLPVTLPSGVDTTFVVDLVVENIERSGRTVATFRQDDNNNVNIGKVVDRSRTRVNVRQVDRTKIKNSDVGTLNQVRNISSDSAVTVLPDQINTTTQTKTQKTNFLSLLKDNLILIIVIVVVIFIYRMVK